MGRAGDRSAFVCLVGSAPRHLPRGSIKTVETLGRIAGGIDRFNRAVGGVVAWLAIFMVLTQFVIVLLRYVFGYGSIFMQESIIYMHGLLFLLYPVA